MSTERVELRDTLREVTTITVQTNDKGDTLKMTTVTDRLRARGRDRIAAQRTKMEVVRDTVYVEKRDSSFVKTNTNFSNDTNQSGRTALHETLKWVFAIIVGLIALTITVKVCLRKA